jgi:regulator of protease activity HflC (stomatin/prohibitin superfamily)
VRVEIQRIDPPADVMSAMHEQMKAERTRRATVTTAQGDREAAIERAEGQKQSKILEAEGHRQSQILDAEGKAEATKAAAAADKFRQIAVAEGEAEAIRQVYSAIHSGGATADVLAVKYLETLAAVANGQATKVFLPIEASSLLGALGGVRELLGSLETAAPNGAVAAPTSP